MVNRQVAPQNRQSHKVAERHCRCIPATPFFSAAGPNLVHIFMWFSFYKLISHFI
jgi:hypothetical protein